MLNTDIDPIADRVPVAIIGSGNIATDLLMKLQRDPLLDVRWMAGIDPASEGLARARAAGLETTSDGVEALLGDGARPDLVFEATSAKAHAANAPRYAEAGITAIDLTPAAVGPYVVPSVNLSEHLGRPRNLNMVTCGGQATIPMVAAVSRVTRVPYAEIVASIASRSAGPGTRANIDEFTHTTADAVCRVGGAEAGKAIIVLNPAEPPILMRNTVYCAIPADADRAAVEASVRAMADDVAGYVPGYRVKGMTFDDGPFTTPGGQAGARISVFLEVSGNGDHLPRYAGNLDIMTASAVRVGESISAHRLSPAGASAR